MKKLPTFTIMMSLVACLALFSSVSLVKASSPAIHKTGAGQDKMGNFEMQKRAKPGTGTDKMGNMEIQKKMKPRPGTEKGVDFGWQDGGISGRDGGVGK